jgi:predicted NAD-dependent protein-ADP-ribosyltransferase YbiA (DUF1768 family)
VSAVQDLVELVKHHEQTTGAADASTQLLFEQAVERAERELKQGSAGAAARGRVTAGPILRFDGSEAGFLSNFAAAVIQVPALAPFELPEGLMAAATTEHAYQALKATNKPDLLWVLQADSPGSAKRRGSRKGEGGVKIALRSDWDDVKRGVMLACLRAKFVPGSEHAARLAATGCRMLVEGNTWGDMTWGAVWAQQHPVLFDREVAGPCWARRPLGRTDDQSGEGGPCEELRGDNWLGRLLMLVRAENDCEVRHGDGE